MPLTKTGDLTFKNQIRLDYVQAYFRKKLIWTRFAQLLLKEFSGIPGKKVDIPYFDKIGDAEKPGEDDKLSVDKLGDNSFSGTVYEVGKAVGITDSARYEKGSTDEKWEKEVGNQMGRVMAEQMDADALAVLNNDGTVNTDGATGADSAGHDKIDDLPSAITLTTPFTAAKGADTAAYSNNALNVRKLQRYYTRGFGDRANEATIQIMHSHAYTDVVVDTTAGFLKADAVSPFKGLDGYESNFLGKETFKIDNLPKDKKITFTDSASASQKYQTYKTFVLKPEAYTMMLKKSAMFETARDILARQDIQSVTQWYTFMTLHKRVDTMDKRAIGITTLTAEQTT